MQDDDGLPFRIARLFDIKDMTVAHIEHPPVERVDRREKKLGCALLAGVSVHDRPI